MTHYNKAKFINALKTSGLCRGDLVFGHSNIGFFGIPEEGKSAQAAFEVILDAILKVIGPSGTIVVPTFSYSYPRGEIFEVNSTPGIGGYFAEEVRKLSEAYRSNDPIFSVAAYGYDAKKITQNTSSNSYDDNGIFCRLLNSKAKILNMNFDAASTFVHYAERKLNVPYRFDKTFSGSLIDKNGHEQTTQHTIWVRYLCEETLPVFEVFDEIAMTKGICEKVEIGRGFLKVMPIEEQFNLVKDTLPKHPFFLVKAGLSADSNNPHALIDKIKSCSLLE